MGNLDSKLSPYYAIADESGTGQSGSHHGHGKSSKHDAKSGAATAANGKESTESKNFFWTIKRVNNFNHELKSATLFEFNHAKFAAPSGAVNGHSPLDSKKNVAKHLAFALNQIKMLKTLRHPNIVKYFYSEECQMNNAMHGKCILITESVRPLCAVIDELSKEQIIRGIFGFTNAICFLHNRVSTSHNNLNENCIYINSKQTWKLNDFELVCGFGELSKAFLAKIYEFKNKNAVTPEEEAEYEADKAGAGTLARPQVSLESVYKQAPHAIDAYGWAMTILNLLPKQLKEQTSSHESAAVKSRRPRKKTNSASKSFTDSTKGLYNTSYITNGHDDTFSAIHNGASDHTSSQFIVDEMEKTNQDGFDDSADEEMLSNGFGADERDNSLEQLELYLNKDPLKRPRLELALNLKLFESYKNVYAEHQHHQSVDSISNASGSSLPTSMNKFDYFLKKINSDEQLNLFDLNQINNLDKLDESWPKLVRYLDGFMGEHGKATAAARVSETLVEFLLSPFMFYSSKAREYLFPCVFIPKEETTPQSPKKAAVSSVNHKYSLKNYVYVKRLPVTVEVRPSNKKISDVNEEALFYFDSFIEEDKYKALVLPRILSLFSIHSLQIRTVLLEYFPFYIRFITDHDTLQYEILPELLLGLKDKNDEIVSLTFNCLAIMVQILGGEIVVGKSSSKQPRQKHFSDNLPKTTLLAPPPPVASASASKPKTAISEVSKLLSSNSSTSFSRHKSEELGGQQRAATSAKNPPAVSNLIREHKLSSTNSLDDELGMNDESIKVNKLFTDSMIALHDENESTDESNSFVGNGNGVGNGVGKEHQPSVNDSNVNDLDDWSNDFGWHKHDNNESSSASLIALSGSNVQLERVHSIFSTTSSSSSSTRQLATTSSNANLTTSNGVAAEPTTKPSLNGQAQFKSKYPSVTAASKAPSDSMGAEFDIKSISIKVKKSPQSDDLEENLIDSFLNEMQPVIKPAAQTLPSKLSASQTTETLAAPSNGSETQSLRSTKSTTAASDKFSVLPAGSAFEMKTLETTATATATGDEADKAWECDEIDLDNL